jgi:hypothetical protein
MDLRVWRGELEPLQVRRQFVKKGQARVEAELYQVRMHEGQFETLAHPS